MSRRLLMPCTMVPAVVHGQRSMEQWNQEEEEQQQLATQVTVRARAVTCPMVRDSDMVIRPHLEPVWELVLGLLHSRRSSLVLIRQATAGRQTEAIRWVFGGTKIELVSCNSSSSGQRPRWDMALRPTSGASMTTLGKPPKPKALMEPSLRMHLAMACLRPVISNLDWVVSHRSASSTTTEVEIPEVIRQLVLLGCSLLKRRIRVAIRRE